jgi:mcrB domain protein
MLSTKRIFESWALKRNVLLYGPPGTGKTRFLSELYNQVRSGETSSRDLIANPENPLLPLAYNTSNDERIPGPIKTYWATFHQSFGYEDFLLGYRPTLTDGGVILQPHAGILLDAILELSDAESNYQSVVIFIDEVNRANASRVFGEFMTFLDFDYREAGSIALPMPLRQLAYKDGKSEKIHRLDGSLATLESGFKFPEHIYIVATMNSVDRSAVPIDSALARRFNRIEMAPERSVLESIWGVQPHNSIKADEEYTAHEVALRLFDSLNAQIANDLGAEFELGHGLFLGISGSQSKAELDQESSNRSWLDLARVWDDVLFPQLEDRYAGRPDALLNVLRISEFTGSDYVWKLRNVPSQDGSIRTLERTQVSANPLDNIKRSFKLLVSDQ